MRSIKIFLASSEELTDDRNAFGNLVRRLDRIYESRGVRIELFEWEDYDAAWSERGKQNEYNDQIKASDMFLALFHTKAGKYTIEEFDVATEEFRKHASPKVYVYCKALEDGEQETAELKEFKRKLLEEMGHYWSRYNNRDSMQLHFVMQLQLVETNGNVERLKVEDGMIVLEGMPIARMDNLQFAAGNEAYCKMNAELAALPELIEKARSRTEKYPDDEDLLDDLQQKLDRYNSLKEEFAQLQKALFETARRITIMQQERVSDMLRRAIEAFEKGNVEQANTILDEIAQEAENHLEQLDQQRDLIHQDIDAFMLQAKTVMADGSIPIDDRIKKTSTIYAKADEWAQKSALPKEKYEKLLSEYGFFLYDYAQYHEAIKIRLRLLDIRKDLYGPGHLNTSICYNNIGATYHYAGEYTKALEYYSMAISFFEKVYGVNHPDTSFSYNNIGLLYAELGDYEKALDYLFKALAVREKEFSRNHPITAICYNNIGTVYYNKGDNIKALEYYSQSMSIFEHALGTNHPNTANSYNCIGLVYSVQGVFDKALEYYNKSVSIRERVLGVNHPITAVSYNNIGAVYGQTKKYNNALEYYHKALSIQERNPGINHPETANTYNNIACVYSDEGAYEKALSYHLKSLSIREKVLGTDHPDTVVSYNNIGTIYGKRGDYDKALEYYFKALPILEKIFGTNHPDTINAYNNIASVYMLMGMEEKAQKYRRKACNSSLSNN